MKKLTLLFLIISTTTFAQQRITKNLGEFNKLKVFSGLRVKLIKSDKEHIEIKGNNSEDVVVKNVNGMLKLSVKLPHAFDEDQTLVRLYFVNEIELIDANEGAVITSDEKLKLSYTEIRAQEGAKIELRIKAQNLKVKAVTGGIITLSGKALNQNVIANTGGIYEGFDLQTQNATVVAATGGEAEVNVSDLLDAKVKFQGFVVYKQKPKNLKKKRLLGGTVCSVEDYYHNGGRRNYN